MYTFNPSSPNTTPAEIVSFMRKTFPSVVFDEDMSMDELQTLANKWIEIGTRAAAHVNKAQSLPVVPKPKPLRRKRTNGNSSLPTEKSEIPDKDRESAPVKRSRKVVEAAKGKDGGINASKKSATTTPRNNLSRASKSEAKARTTSMYNLTDDRRTRRNTQPSVTVLNDSKTNSTATDQLQESKEDRTEINDSSSLTGLSDDDEIFVSKRSRSATTSALKSAKIPTCSVFDELEGLQLEPQKAAGQFNPDSTHSWDAPEETLIDGLSHDIRPLDQLEKDLIDLGQMDLFQLPNTGDIKCEIVEPHHHSSDVSYSCNSNCQREINALKARIEKLEDLVFPPYRIPPACVTSLLEEYHRI